MRARKFSQKLIITVALVAVTAAACGSSSKGASSTTTPTTAASSSAGSPTTAAGSSATPTTAKPKSFSGSSSSNFCAEARSIQSATPSASSATQTPAQAKKQYSDDVKAAEKAESAAPSAIKGDFATFVSFIKAFNDAYSKAGYNYENLDPTAFSKLYTSSIQTAGEHITAYLTQVCHITSATPTT